MKLLFGHNFGVLDKIYETRVQGSDSVAWVKGKHYLRFGADINYIQNYVAVAGIHTDTNYCARHQLPGGFCQFVKPSAKIPSNPAEGPCPMALPPYNTTLPPFPAVPGPNPADPANGVPVAFQSAPLGSAVNFTPGVVETLPTNGWPYAYLPEQEKNFSVTLNHGYYGFFVQDQWKVTPKLNINYGLRWDFESGLSQQMDVSHKGFQPRVGLAYSPDKKTVIRAGFGLFDDRYSMSFLFITYPQRPAILPNADLPPNRRGAESAPYELRQFPFIPVPVFRLRRKSPATFSRPARCSQRVLSALPTSVGYSYTDRHSPIPYSEQANIEIDREIGHGFTIGVGYLFVAAHHLLRSTLGNVCPVREFRPDRIPAPRRERLPPYRRAILPANRTYSGIPRYPAGLICCNDLTGNSAYHGGTLAAEQNRGQILQYQRELHLFPHDGRWHLCHVHQCPGGHLQTRSGKSHVEPGCAASLRHQLRVYRPLRYLHAELPAEQHRRPSERLGRLRYSWVLTATTTSSQPPTASGIYPATPTRVTSSTRGISASRAASTFLGKERGLNSPSMPSTCSTART